jgi:hypothetical protein
MRVNRSKQSVDLQIDVESIDSILSAMLQVNPVMHHHATLIDFFGATKLNHQRPHPTLLLQTQHESHDQSTTWTSTNRGV